MNIYKKKRMLRKFKKENKEVLDLDITSLLDILVILLVFLLKSYNASDLKIDLVENMSLPNSRSTTLGNQSIIVQVNRNRKIFINNKLIGKYKDGVDTIPILFSKLVNSKIPSNISDKNIIKTKTKKINIVLDKSLPYKVLSRVMHTSALAGFPEFKFIVQGKYE
ncbi:MAG: hypothetical protein HN576_13865 [Bacteriovoracaceae bacterium]|mgnify:CR=1 FL=1|jgi:biopolymer transport protein ExbD|nr:hypothetical protein [Bacteriovoracaceae bacterium]